MTVICPKGAVLRKGFVRRSYIRSNGARISRALVKSICVNDLGLPGKGPKLIGKLKKGKLIKYGYRSALSDIARHRSLGKAIKSKGKGVTIRRLNAIRTLTKNTNPKISKIYDQDLRWVQNKVK